MVNNYVWMFFVILRCIPVSPKPTHNLYDSSQESTLQPGFSAQNVPKYEASPSSDQVISVRITSSVAVGRRKGKPPPRSYDTQYTHDLLTPTAFTETISTISTITNESFKQVTDLPPNLIGANIEFIKQLNAKKDKLTYTPNPSSVYQTQEKKEIYDYAPETKPVYEIDSSKELSIESSYIESLPIYHNLNENENFNKNSNYSDSIAEPSLKSVRTYKSEAQDSDDIIPQARSMPSSYHSNQYPKKEILLQDTEIEQNRKNKSDSDQTSRNINPISNITNQEDVSHNIPLGRSISISPSPDNYFSGLNNKPVSAQDISASLTTVSFNVVHDTQKQANNYDQATTSNENPISDNTKFYEPPKIYSQPAQIYSEPAKFYSEPAKVYSEPAKIYSEPAKIYSEPAKIYSEPAKFYSPPASLHLPPVPADYRPWQQHSQSLDITSTSNTTPTTVGTSANLPSTKRNHEHQPEKNYEVDEKISVLSEGRIHGVQESTTEKCKEDNCKVGYVVEGRQYKKYRVEERTSDGFIVGEYGVVRNEDGALRGVRYTADGDASPRLIYDALMKFLQLK
ncbi:uncharacterized protein LOC128676771 [Plodia interpunctella]|uniref:uncharacterized protein LOC128676771 n=1 Tax=Plodia interpunctella TaxID=58824 RepID=UPI002368CD2A|nr:uncharacterized protein LOC128676771 [Plodia interpunctella]